ncbi:MAG: 2-hydroxyacid dehydrogenase [Cellvibrionaceae bacterium]
MRIAVFSAKSYDKHFLSLANQHQLHEIDYYEARLNINTVALATGYTVICAFVNDQLDKKVLNELSKKGIKVIAMRCAGYNNVDLSTAKDLGIQIVRVPAYSPYSVAEHTIALMLTLNRHIHKAYNRVREGNFSLDGLLGFDMHGKTVGIIGTGKIGIEVVRILNGFGCNILANDITENSNVKKLSVKYVELSELLEKSDIVTLHCPLTPQTYHIINQQRLSEMKKGVMLINTSRGALIETKAMIAGLKTGHLGYLGLDVYEEEADLFFEDLSNKAIQDDVFARLLTFPNVVITGHQAFFTQNALSNIATTTLNNITAVEQGELCKNRIEPTN